MKYHNIRRFSKTVAVGSCRVGGDAPIAIQSMTNTDTRDTAACVAQIERIARAGAPYIGIPLRSLNIRSSALVAVIVRGSHVLVPFGDDTIEADDRVVIITCETGIVDLNDVMGQKTHE